MKKSANTKLKMAMSFITDVESGTTGILQRVSHGITHNSCLVHLTALLLHHALDLNAALLNVLLRVVPCASSVTAANSHLYTARDGTSQETSYRRNAKENTEQDGGKHDQHTRENHLLQTRVGANLDATSVVGLSVAGCTLQKAWDLLKLPGNLDHHFLRPRSQYTQTTYYP